MDTHAVVLAGPRDLTLESLTLDAPGEGQLVVEIAHSGISTGTEKLFWRGEMPPFPGMGYPLVPGYESAGEVVEAPRDGPLKVGDTVFVPGASCYGDVRGLFGGAASTIVTDPSRVISIDAGLGETGALLALAATARHAIAGVGRTVPELIVGHGVLGRLLARLTVAAGAPAPVVWEQNPARRTDEDYPVIAPEDDPRRDYRSVFDATGDSAILDQLMMRIAKGGEIVLAGFYAAPISFAFPPAFMKEVQIRVAAEWSRDDLVVTRSLIDAGALSLDGLVTHRRPAADALQAYKTAFNDPDCLKMILDWKGDA